MIPGVTTMKQKKLSTVKHNVGQEVNKPVTLAPLKVEAVVGAFLATPPMKRDKKKAAPKRRPKVK